MPYIDPTAANLKSRFPAFAAVADSVVSQTITEAKRFVDETWNEDDYQIAIMLGAAHIMTLDGLGTGAQSQVYAQGMAGYQSIRSGALSLSRGSSSSSSGSASNWSATTYGQRFLAYLKMNRGGPLVTGGECAGVSPYAKDTFWPWVYGG